MPSQKIDRRRKPKLYPVPLKQAAKELGVTKPHLSLVLRGLRDSASLKRRYRDLASTTLSQGEN